MTPSPSPSLIGRHKSELDTPALCIDLDLMEANVAAMSGFLRQQGKQWRPHAKCHKSPIIAQKLVDSGAIGVTVAKVSEAAVYIEAGIPDVLIANMIVGAPKLERVAELCRRGRPIVAVDHFVQAEALAEVCRRHGVTCRIVLEVNIGLHRVGVRPGLDARDLARGVSKLPGVELVGMMGYEGHLLRIADPEEKRRKIFSAMDILLELKDHMAADGLCADIVSAGGTGSYQITSAHPVVTELQAGGGMFADPFYLQECGVNGLTTSQFVIATVVSRGKLERAVLDVGRKSVHPDIHPPTVPRTVLGRALPDASVVSLSAEHMTLELGPQSQELAIGDKVEVVPGYTDHTTVLHDWFFGIRQDRVESIWPITARGCLQ